MSQQQRSWLSFCSPQPPFVLVPWESLGPEGPVPVYVSEQKSPGVWPAHCRCQVPLYHSGIVEDGSMVSRMSWLIQVSAHTTVMSRVTSKIILCRSYSLSSLQSQPLCWENRARGAFSSANHKLCWTRPPWESRNHVVTQGPRKYSLFPKRVLFAGIWPPLWPLVGSTLLCT